MPQVSVYSFQGPALMVLNRYAHLPGTRFSYEQIELTAPLDLDASESASDRPF